MTKEELLQELSHKVITGEMSRDEVFQYFGGVPSQMDGDVVASVAPTQQPSTFSVMKLLYILGAAIVTIGLSIFIAQVWDAIGSFGRISVTLGLGIILTLNGSILLKSKPDNSIGSVFHFIGGLLIPGGAMVLLYEIIPNISSVWPIAFLFGIVTGFYILLNSAHKTPVLTFFAIANGTMFSYLFTEAVLGDAFGRSRDILYSYLTMAIGLGYLYAAYSFRTSWNSKLVSFLYFFGSAGFFLAAFTRTFNSGIWEMLYFIVAMGGVALAVRVRSRGILIVSTLALIAHVSVITGRYFADSLGWPIALIFLGFVFIGLGYASVNINKRFIATQV